MAAVVTLTMNPSLDANTDTDEVVPNAKLRCGPIRYEPGGGGVNVSRAVRRLGGETASIYTSGGQTGRVLRRLLEREGIEADPIPIAGTTNENVHVTARTTGDQFRFTLPGPELEREEWEACLDEVLGLQPPPAYLVASGSLPPGVPADFHARLARMTGKSGARLIVDTGGEAFRLALREGVFCAKPNRRELGEASGRQVGDAASAEAAARALLEGGSTQALVVSLGAQGALLVPRDGPARSYRPPEVPNRSCVGAGDSMVGGIVLRLSQGAELPEAVGFGVAAGAAACMTPGTELCRREDTERLYPEVEMQTHGGPA